MPIKYPQFVMGWGRAERKVQILVNGTLSGEFRPLVNALSGSVHSVRAGDSGIHLSHQGTRNTNEDNRQTLNQWPEPCKWIGASTPDGPVCTWPPFLMHRMKRSRAAIELFSLSKILPALILELQVTYGHSFAHFMLCRVGLCIAGSFRDSWPRGRECCSTDHPGLARPCWPR